MSMLIDILSWIMLLTGSILLIIGAIGLHRLPEFFTRTHAGSVTDSGAAAFILIGLMLQAGLTLITAKLFLILLFLWFTSPTASHVLAQSALRDGLRPEAEEKS